MHLKCASKQRFTGSFIVTKFLSALHCAFPSLWCQNDYIEQSSPHPELAKAWMQLEANSILRCCQICCGSVSFDGFCMSQIICHIKLHMQCHLFKVIVADCEAYLFVLLSWNQLQTGQKKKWRGGGSQHLCSVLPWCNVIFQIVCFFSFFCFEFHSGLVEHVYFL